MEDVFIVFMESVFLFMESVFIVFMGSVYYAHRKCVSICVKMLSFIVVSTQKLKSPEHFVKKLCTGIYYFIYSALPLCWLLQWYC